MTPREERLKKYGQACECLPPRVRCTAMRSPENEKLSAEEFRLRAGEAFSIMSGKKEYSPDDACTVRREELQTVIELATRSSVHASEESIRQGYITVFGGHRIGVCGTFVPNGIKDISSVSVRIAKSVPGAADDIYGFVFRDGKYRNTLIIAPPGCGKTTLLRDAVRLLSNGGFRVSLVDERGEIAAKYRGVPQFDVGRRTDVVDGINKARGAMHMLKTMTPDIIAVDEITAEEDLFAMQSISNCGVGLMATAHGDSAESLVLRPLYKKLYELGIFECAVTIKKDGQNFMYSVREI